MHVVMKYTALLLALSFIAAGAKANDSLRSQLTKISKTIDAEVGIAVLHLESKDTLTINGMKRFPMQSVYKFHLGLAILDLVDKGKLTMDQKIRITKEDYYPTWSPLASKYPEAEVDVTIGELLAHSVSHSDNVACDVLFRLAGGPWEVQRYLESIGAKDISIVSTEKEMHASWEIQFKNWNTPYAMVHLLDQFHSRKFLSEKSYVFMLQAMINCPMGPRRIKGFLPNGTIVAHRTGTGAPNEHNVMGAINDVGIITLPNNEHVAIACYISRSSEEQKKVEAVIAQIAKIVFGYYTSR